MPYAKYPRFFNTRLCLLPKDECTRPHCFSAHSQEELRCESYARGRGCDDPDACNRLHDDPERPRFWRQAKKRRVVATHLRTYRGSGTLFRSYGAKPRLNMPDYVRRLTTLKIPEDIMREIAQDHESAKRPLMLPDYVRAVLKRSLAISTRDQLRDLRKYQLMVELAQSQHDIRYFDKANAKFTPSTTPAYPGAGKKFVDLVCPGVAEKRPSVLRGDAVRACGPDGHWIEGYVHWVNLDTLVINVCNSVVLSWSYHVVFSMPTTNTDRQFTAIMGGDFHHLNAASTNASLLVPSLAATASRPAVLNDDGQWQFVQSVLTAPKRLHLLHGPPGTGKTHTLCHLVSAIAQHMPNARVLVMTPSNVSADLVVTRLRAAGTRSGLLRVVAASRDPKTIPDDVKPHCPPSSCVTTRDLESAKVVVCTLMTASVVFGVTPVGHACGKYTHIIIDEAAQATEAEVSVGLQFLTDSPGASVILAGDHKQLGPMIRNSLCKASGMDKSPLERLCIDEQALNVMLKRNYRSVPPIVSLFNPTYGGQLVPNRSNDTSAQFDDTPVEFIHVEGKETREKDSPSWLNSAEIEVVRQQVESLLVAKRIAAKDIVVLAPYQKQCQKIRACFHHDSQTKHAGFASVKVCSVEMFQGAEARVVILSTVRSFQEEEVVNDRKYDIGFLRNSKRLNVAISRAQDKLIIVGNAKLLQAADPEWLALVDAIEVMNGLRGVAASAVVDRRAWRRAGEARSNGATVSSDDEDEDVSSRVVGATDRRD